MTTRAAGTGRVHMIQLQIQGLVVCSVRSQHVFPVQGLLTTHTRPGKLT